MYLLCENSEITALLRHCIVGKFILKTYLVSELSAPRERNGQLQTNKSLCCKIGIFVQLVKGISATKYQFIF